MSFNDWFLPSKDEIKEMYDELYLFGVGDFMAGTLYWSSSEGSATMAWFHGFSIPLFTITFKQVNGSVRACRAFTSLTVYALRDIGPAGGWIFWKSGNDYLEAAPSDCDFSIWSNIYNVAIGTTGTAIGTGQANTTAIIGQAGHITSAAKLCDDLITGT
jgi:hypothetical protein